VIKLIEDGRLKEHKLKAWRFVEKYNTALSEMPALVYRKEEIENANL
jgi:hypothetical protein